MFRGGGLVLLALSMTGCATVPQQHLAKLNAVDPAYETPGCVAARQAAASFNNHVASRAGAGLALGLLGPVGLPFAVASDVHANTRRKAANTEVDKQCSTPGVAFDPKSDHRNCHLDPFGEAMICEPVS